MAPHKSEQEVAMPPGICQKRSKKQIQGLRVDEFRKLHIIGELQAEDQQQLLEMLREIS